MGEDLRVADASVVRYLETDRLSPEIMILGDRVPFRALHDAEGTAYGARRIGDPEVVAEAGGEAVGLYATAEPLLDYLKREITPFPSPASLPGEPAQRRTRTS